MTASLGPQFEIVYHNSFHPEPPHHWGGSSVPSDYQKYSNTTPTHFHAGTKAAAESLGRPFLHKYLINREHIHPVTLGDEEETLYGLTSQEVTEGMEKHGVLQRELFEEDPISAETMRSTKGVIPYRNHAEDMGSISYAIPKDEIGGKAVRFLGTEDRRETAAQELKTIRKRNLANQMIKAKKVRKKK